ncbi:MAG: hypothetical protein GY851_28615 [bacterium]|nr:hypothetical protein [bacterium]
MNTDRHADPATLAASVVAPIRIAYDAPPAKIPSDTAVDAPLLGNGSVGVAVGYRPGQVDFYLARNDFWRLKTGYGECMPKPFGRFSLKFKGLKKARFSAEQCLYPPVTDCTLTTGKGTVLVRCWVSATEDVLALELRSEGIQPEVSFELMPQRSDDSTVEEGDSLQMEGFEGGWAVRRFEEGVEIPTSAACVVRQTAKETPFRLDSHVPVWVGVGLEGGFDNDDPVAAANDAATLVAFSERKALWEAHEAWWAELWAKSVVVIDDPDIMRHYYLSNYVMASCCRDPRFPPSIFGGWITTDKPAWHGDYHLNYNHMAPYYGLYSSNHIEQADVYHDPILRMMDRARDYARVQTGCAGVLYPVGIGPMGMDSTANPTGDYVWEKPEGAEEYGLFFGQKSNAAYCCTNLAMRFYHTWDPEYARTVYPFVKEVAAFWQDYLRFEDGRYMDYKDAIHESVAAHDERYLDVNPVLTLGLLRQTFQLALDLADTVADGDAPREKWTHILNHLPEWPTQERNGKKVFRYSERGTDWFVNNTLGIQHIYPAGAIGLESDGETLAVARNTIEVMKRWTDHNGMNSFFPAAVRVGYDPEIILERLNDYVTKHANANGFAKDNPHGIENCSIVPNTVNEMLCMGHQGVLRVFGVWPRTRDARFVDLRAQGAFLVSSELAAGTVTYVRIASERGRPCVLVNPWPGGQAVVKRTDGTETVMTGDCLSFDTVPGETLLVLPGA